MTPSDVSVEAINRTSGERTTIALQLVGTQGELRRCRLRACHGPATWTGEGADYFAALQEVRRELENNGWLLNCYGASKNVWPSAMARDMGQGLQAYRVRMGEPGRRDDLVGIFETGEDVQPATVQEQAEFHRAWFESLKHSSR